MVTQLVIMGVNATLTIALILVLRRNVRYNKAVRVNRIESCEKYMSEIQSEINQLNERFQVLEVARIMEFTPEDKAQLANQVTLTFHNIVATSILSDCTTTISPADAFRQAKILHGIIPRYIKNKGQYDVFMVWRKNCTI